MKTFQLSRRGNELKPVLGAHPHDVIAFGVGDACPDLMPDLTAEADCALTQFRPETLQYAVSRLGLEPLREWISDNLRTEGISATPAEIIVVNGAKHGLDLACRLILNEGDCIAVTAPTYFTGIPIFKSYGVTFLEVPQDSEGISVDFLRDEIIRLSVPKIRSR